MLRQLRETVQRTGATVVFVATDGDSMAGDIEGMFNGKVRRFYASLSRFIRYT